MIRAFVRPFDLGHAPLFRAMLAEMEEGRYLLLFDIHHIVSDGTSMGILVRDFMGLYRDEPLPELRAGYCDFAGWSFDRKSHMEEQIAFWRDQLRAPLPMNHLPTGFSLSRQSVSGDLFESFLEPELAEGLKRLARGCDATLYMVLFSLHSLLTANLCGQEDVVVGTAVHGRSASWMEPLVGMFVNTLAVRVKPRFDRSYSEFLRQLKRHLLECFACQDVALEDVVEDPGQLLDTVFVLQNMEVPDLSLRGLEVEQLPYHHQVARFRLTLMAQERDGGIHLAWEYNDSLFRRRTIERFAGYFRRMARAIVENADVPVRDIGMLGQDEQTLLLEVFGKSGDGCHSPSTFQRMLAAQVERNPDAVAIGDDWLQLSYAQLDRLSDCLSHNLRAGGVGAQDIVASMIPRSPLAVAAMVGILKCGAVYLPIEENLPVERKRFMLNDSAASMALVMGGIDPALDVPVPFCLADEMADCGDAPLRDMGRAGDAAYIIYTSGTTGTPKGVVVEQRGLSGLRRYFEAHFPVGPGAGVLQFAAFSFDASVWEMAMGLLTGSTLKMAPQDIRMESRLLQPFMKRHKITVATLPPAVAGYLDPGGLEQLLCLITAGSEASAAVMEAWRGRALTVNAYGPTETTVCASCWIVPSNDRLPEILPIGRPFADSHVTIVDRYGRLCPIGVTGEIVVAGPGVARGYLNRPVLSGELFIDPGEGEVWRRYRTGDLGRWTAEGMIEFLGRLDRQVNIRGFRVELGEVQTVVSQYPGIQDCWVIPVEEEDGDVCLVGYIAVGGDGAADETRMKGLREYLLERLPGYMIPSRLIPVAEIPLTPHGKPDASRLPDPFESTGAHVEPPLGEGEMALARLWSWVLMAPLETIGRESNFFAIGGQSLKAVRLAARIQHQTAKPVTAAEIFRYPCLREMARYIDSLEVRIAYPPLRAYEKMDYYPASSVQRRLFILQEREPGSTAYNMPVILRLEGELDRERLQAAFNRLAARHESFRTSFLTVDGQVAQRVSAVEPVVMEEYQEEAFVRPFDLKNGPLLRVAVAGVSPGVHILAVDMHHIVSDGASMEILVAEFLDLYGERRLPPLDVQYRDYSLWLEEEEVKRGLEAQKRFWTRQFDGDVPRLRLPNDFAYNGGPGSGGRIASSIGPSYVSRLKRLAREEGATLFMAVLAAYYAWLASVSGQEDIVVGVGNNGRFLPETKGTIGMFVNTLALRMELDRTMGFRRFLRRVRDYSLQAFDNQFYPFEDVVEAVGAKAAPGRNPLFDVMLRFDDLEIPLFQLPGIQVTVLDQNAYTSKFHLTLEAAERDDSLAVALEYNGGLFTHDTAEMMARQLRRVLEAAAEDCEQSLRQLPALPPREKNALLRRLNREAERPIEGFDDSITIQSRLWESTERYGDGVAFQQGDRHLSFQALNHRTAVCGRYLQQEGVGVSTIVGILMKDRLSIIQTMLAIMYAGGVFVPLDPELPPKRLEFMIRSANCARVLDDDWPVSVPAADVEGAEVDPEYRPDDPLYIYFTSGTTGTPKGFLGRNNSLAHFIAWERSMLGAGVGDRFSQLIIPTFDAFLRDVFTPLLSGGRICSLPAADMMLEAGALRLFTEQYDIQFVHCVPSVFRLLSAGAGGRESYPGLKAVLMSGERLEPRDLKRWYGVMGNRVKLYNLYGTSETTMAKSCYPVEENDVSLQRVPMGTGIPGAALMVLDAAGDVCGPLAVGEIHIATKYSTFGYVDDPELTHGKLNGQWHRTGDLGRMRADGAIDFLGREDRQVKVRGVRVELAEIERALCLCPGVEEGAVVPLLQENDTRILGFISPGVDDISEFLESYLPAYMMPSRVVSLERMPRNRNGKIDYAALETMVETIASPVVPPEGPIEQRLLHLWNESFKERVMGVETPFFEVGGNSLNLMKLLLRIQREFNASVSLQDLFRLPTIRKQAEFLAASAPVEAERLEPVESMDYYPLSPQQQRLFFLQQLDPQGTHYNMCSCFLLEGGIDVERMRDTIFRLALRQQALRTEFAVLQGHPAQRVVEPDRFAVDVRVVDGGACSGADVTEMIRPFIRPFDLTSAPLFRLGLIPVAEDKHVLVFDYHHIIGDGISGELFMAECMELYQGREFSPLSLQYVDYAVWSTNRRQGDVQLRDREYWLNRFAGPLPILDLPLDVERPPVQDTSGDRIDFQLPESAVRRLVQVAESRDATVFMVLLSAFYLFLARVSGQTDLVVGTPVAGRTQKELQSIIGLFVNSLALRNSVEAGDTFDLLLRRVKADTMAALSHQDYQFEELVEALAAPRDMARNPLFDVMFVLQNYERSAMDLPGFEVSPVRFAQRSSRFDLTLWGWQQEDGLDFSLEYSTRLFRPSTARGFVNIFRKIVDAVLLDPDRPVMTIDIVGDEERGVLLERFNRSRRPYPHESTLHGVIGAMASENRGKIAVQMGSHMMSYGGLVDGARNLAAYLLERGLGPEEIVGVKAYNRIDFIVAVLGILTAGGGVMPMDPDLPPSRIDFMIQDAACRMVLDSRRLQDYLGNHADGGAQLADLAVHSLHLAYIIYSSGTTGTPKGSLLSHQNILRLLAGPGIAGFQPDDRNLQLVNYMFDVSIFDIFSPLLSGGTLLLMDKSRMMEPGFIKETILRLGATLTFMPTSLFNMLVESDIQCFAPLRKVVVGGEALSFSHTGKALEFLGPGRIVNAYGPSENSIVTTDYEFETLEGGRVPIGKPSPNSKVYIIDGFGNLQPIGVIGELCIGGVGLARGYMNRPELTAERFVSHPALPGERLYRTGDLARWLPDGNLEFFGRLDLQVKIRGFRVELGEIESRLQEHPLVNEAVVLALDDCHQTAFLCAYIVAAKGGVSAGVLQDYLGSRLPSYMVPASFVMLEALPLTPNGKVDRKALPSPEQAEGDGELEMPRDDVERMVADLWAGVLGRPADHIGIRRKFFDCGGQSLKATILVARLFNECQVRMPLADFYRDPTIEGMANWIRSARKQNNAMVAAVEKMDYYPLSYAQKRLYFLSRLEPDSVGYNITSVLQVEGRLDLRRIQETFQTLARRHEMFRTSFEERDGQPVQRVHEQVSLEVNHQVKADWDVADYIRPFDLARAPLVRVNLIEVAENRHVLLLDIHHIISDGTSMDILIREFTALYGGQSLPAPDIHYKDYSLWLGDTPQQEMIRLQREFWLEQFHDGGVPLDMLLDFPRPATQSFRGGRYDFRLPDDLFLRVTDFGRRQGTTLFMVLLTALDILLARLCNQEDVVVGTPIAGRFHPSVEGMMGMFVNTLPLRNAPVFEKTCLEFLAEVKESAIQAFENQAYPFEELVDRVVSVRDMSRNPLFDVMLVLQNMDMAEIRLPDLTVASMDVDTGMSKFDLTLRGMERDGQLLLSLEYCVDLFMEATVKTFAGYFVEILHAMALEPGQLTGRLEMMTPERKRETLRLFDAKAVDFPTEATVHRLFEERAGRHPDAVALTVLPAQGDDAHCISYGELNRLANRLARRLRRKGAAAGGLVPVMLTPSPEMMISLLAILKAGSAYVPIDPTYPSQRILYMLRDTAPAVVVAEAGAMESLHDGPLPPFVLLSPFEEESGVGEPLDDNGEAVSPGDPAYVIYTSGTTGKPKGVVIEHRNLARLFFNEGFQFDFGAEDVWTLFHSYCFDFSVWEMYGALLYGGRLVVFPRSVSRDSRRFLEVLAAQGVTVLNQTPSAFRYLTAEMLAGGAPAPRLRYVIFGGEALNPAELRQWRQQYPHVRLVNMYGITETTVHVTYKEIGEAEIKAGGSNIGGPIPTLSLYVMNSYLDLQPAGAKGELTVGGEGVARGYLNRPELTAERFVADPFDSGGRLYRSGDLARQTIGNGDLEYLGRMDRQVKIRGFRIETGEIENRLLLHPDVLEAVVIPRRAADGDHYLCAYIRGDGEEPAPQSLKDHLGEHVPEYMIPARFVEVEAIPLTRNGKVDIQALPEPGVEAEDGYVAAGNPVEARLVDVWAELLNIDAAEVGIRHNFFQLGGHSLKATTLASRVEKIFGVKIPLTEIFRAPCIADMARFIQNSSKERIERIEPAPLLDRYPLSPSQRMIFIELQMEADNLNYNISTAVRLTGDLDVPRLNRVFQQLVERHEVLRSSFAIVEGEPAQIVATEIRFEIIVRHLAEPEPAERLIREFIRPFDLARAPLLRVEAVMSGQRECLLLVDMHHIVADGTSMGILMREFMDLYSGRPLPPLGIQYKDYAVWLKEEGQVDMLKRQQAFWLEQLAGPPPIARLPFDFPKEEKTNYEGERSEFFLPEDLFRKIESMAADLGITLFMALLGAFNILLARLCDVDEVVVGTPVANRRHPDLEPVIGMFVNTLALRNRVEGEQTVRDYFAAVKERTLQAFENQEYPFESLAGRLLAEQYKERDSVFDVFFSMANEDIPEVEIEGLTLTPEENPYRRAPFDLVLICREVDSTLRVSFLFPKALFKEETIQRFFNYFTEILTAAVHGDDIDVKDICISHRFADSTPSILEEAGGDFDF
jgi:tyrocidine synthetase-3